MQPQKLLQLFWQTCYKVESPGNEYVAAISFDDVSGKKLINFSSKYVQDRFEDDVI